MAEYKNTVPLGREGTGGAQILGASRAVQYLTGLADREQNRLLSEQQRYQQTQQQYNNAFQKDLMQLNELAASPMYSQDFNELTNKVAEQGKMLISKGYNPYNPNASGPASQAIRQWQNEVNQLKTAKARVDELYKKRKALVDYYGKHADEYDPDEFKEIFDFEKNYSLQDILNGQDLPTITKKLDIDKAARERYRNMSTLQTDYIKDDKGNPMYREFKGADKERIISAIDSDFSNPNSPFYTEVNRQIRKTFGKEFDMTGLLDTTDPAELRTIIDAEFRNPSGTELIAEAKAKGKNINFDTPEYEQLLDVAVQEQLRAEKILRDAKQKAIDSAINAIPNSTKARLDYTAEREKRAKESHALNQQAKRISISNAQKEGVLKDMRIAKGITGDDVGLAESLLDSAEDVDLSGEDGSNIVAFNTIPLTTASVNINPTETNDTFDGSKVKLNGTRGSISGVGVIAYDKDGKIIPGNNPEELIKTGKVAKFEARTIVSEKKGRRTIQHPLSNGVVPISNLSDKARKNVSVAQKTAESFAAQLNGQLKGNSSSSSSNKSGTLKKVNNPIVKGNAR